MQEGFVASPIVCRSSIPAQIFIGKTYNRSVEEIILVVLRTKIFVNNSDAPMISDMICLLIPKRYQDDNSLYPQVTVKDSARLSAGSHGVCDLWTGQHISI